MKNITIIVKRVTVETAGHKFHPILHITTNKKNTNDLKAFLSEGDIVISNNIYEVKKGKLVKADEPTVAEVISMFIKEEVGPEHNIFISESLSSLLEV